MSRPEALAAALTRAGYTCTVEGRLVHVRAPAFTLAHVRLDEDGFACVFDANELFARPRAGAAAWRKWVRDLRTTTGSVAPHVAHLPLPSAAVAPAPTPTPVDLSSCLDTYRHGPAVPDRCAYAWDEVREHRFALYTLHEAPAWSSMSSDDLGWAGPSIGWHAWAEPVAAGFGAARGWAQIAGQTIDTTHPARTPVERVLLAAAERFPAPAGIVALDLRGLAPELAAKLVTALVCAARDRGAVRGAIVLCAEHASYFVARVVDLDCLPRQNDAQQSLALD